MENYKNQYDDSEFEMTYDDQAYYLPRLTLDRSKFEKGETIPVISIINHNLYNKGEEISKHDTVQTMKSAVCMNYGEPKPPIDSWTPQSDADRIFTHIRGAIIAPVHKIYRMSDNTQESLEFDYFSVTVRKSFNSSTKVKKDGTISIGFRDHCVQYLNYFEKYYDKEHKLLVLYARLKYMIDVHKEYTLDNLLSDLWKYFINPNGSSMATYLNYYLDIMNMEQYTLDDLEKYKNNRSPVLEYSDFHAKIMLKISVMQNMIIPIVSHFMSKKSLNQLEIEKIFLRAFDLLFQINEKIYNVNIAAKLYETAFSNVAKNVTSNSKLWEMQPIRARNQTSHSMETVQKIIFSIIPKYTYDKNIIHFNYNSINREIKYQVTDIAYEFGFIPLSSSSRDEDNNSECDKFEAHAAKLNEATLIQTQVNCQTTMDRIEMKYGPFDDREIEFYRQQLQNKEGKLIVNSLQKNLIVYLFAKEFDDPQSIKIMNARQYIILIIAARRLLESYKLFQLPYIIGGKVVRVVTRKNINKKELQKIQSSKYYPLIHEKYNNPKIEHDVILMLIAQVLSSEFQTIDYYHPENNGKPINVIPDIVSDEICRFVMLI